ncbi:MAG: hypothetical protein KDD33_03085 [Bdellovibrionales bacterium]|nr:hypothetical protein [Bdellovibrionales bacterium]
MDSFYISYDEPNKEENWRQIQGKCPGVQRVDGVEGFNNAYQECARRSKTERFFTIDGDNVLLDIRLGEGLTDELLQTDYIFSWSAENSINGLAYGNGGVKNWPRSVVIAMKSHESAGDERSSVDFCFSYKYFQMPQVLSRSVIDKSPYQAFRAGFREGVKMTLVRGERLLLDPDNLSSGFHELVSDCNKERLKIWCSIGRDRPFGKWAILGARLGCSKVLLEDFPMGKIRDYRWFDLYWKNEIESEYLRGLLQEEQLEHDLKRLKENLNENLDLGLVDFSEEQSLFFKSVYFNRPRYGLMFDDL